MLNMREGRIAWSEKVDEYVVEIERLSRMMFGDADERRLLDAVDILNRPLALRLLGIVSSIPRMVLPLLLLAILR